MQVIDEITRKRVSTNRARRIVVQHLPGMIVFGYSTRSETQVPFLAYEKEQGLSKHLGDYELLKDVLVYSNMRGMYLSTVDLPDGELLTEIYSKGQGSFPYSFNRKYEAVESFNIFAGKQHLVDGSKKYPISSFLKYTFGLEFETSQGYVPENICFRDGLIPLRDGSISGLEYSTVVLQGNDGISMLKQQLETLKKYTSFNKECSLHVHLGGFPLDPDKLFRVCVLCKNLEYSIQSVVPRYTFRTSEYKKSGKDYCLPLKQFRDFKQMYGHLVGRRFYGSFTQPHPNDIRREAKWHINTRYYWVNFINALCYDVNKTIEFRLLRPTYNFKKILLWMYIFNAILKYADEVEDLHAYRDLSLEMLIERVYPADLSKSLILGVKRLRILTENQSRNGDYNGSDISFEDELFPDNLDY